MKAQFLKGFNFHSTKTFHSNNFLEISGLDFLGNLPRILELFHFSSFVKSQKLLLEKKLCTPSLHIKTSQKKYNYYSKTNNIITHKDSRLLFLNLYFFQLYKVFHSTQQQLYETECGEAFLTTSPQLEPRLHNSKFSTLTMTGRMYIQGYHQFRGKYHILCWIIWSKFCRLEQFIFTLSNLKKRKRYIIHSQSRHISRFFKCKCTLN